MTNKNQRKKPGPKPGTKRKTPVKKQEINPEVKTEIILIVVFALCIILFLSNFHLIGVFGEVISSVFFGLLGFLSYIFPIALFLLIAFFMSNKNNIFAIKKIVFSVILFVFIGVICQLLVGDSLNNLESLFINNSGSVIKELYNASSKNHSGGGVLFGGIAFLLYHYIGMIGTIILTIVICIIAILFLSQKSILKSMKEHSTKMIVIAKSEKNRRKEDAILRKEENNQLKIEEMSRQADEQLLRKDKKVRGVMIDTIIKKEIDDLVTNDIHEINIFENEDFSDENMEEIFIRGAKPEKESYIKTENQEIKEIDQIFVGAPSDYRKNAIEKKKTEENKIAQEENLQIEKEFSKNERFGNKKYIFPPISLLTKPTIKKGSRTAKELRETAMQLQQTLENFGVNVTITDISQGPVVTRYELQPEQGVKVSKIVSLADDIKLNLAATDIRIEAPIPGKAAIGIEVPNKENSAVDLRELIEAKKFDLFPSNLTFAVGKDIGGESVLFDISKMPHVLIAGATGSGKSVCINTIIMSLLYKAHPDDVKLIMIDPKVVELNVYNGIPHLLIPVVTEPKKAAAALHWGVTEMTERYKVFADLNVRDLKGYNKKVESMTNQPNSPKKLPQIVIIVDELADLMMVAPGEVEESICRLSQLARAAGIHLIIATQRPSVDVITGLIKANMPSRIAFSVSSGVDSRTILDMNGAEKLLGKGDMLFYPQGYSKPIRVQGAFVSDKDVFDVVDFLKKQAIRNDYSDKIDEQISNIKKQSSTINSLSIDNEQDIYFEEAGRFILEKEKASIGMLQRVFKIGFNRAARIMDQLCEIGLVGPEEGTKPRTVLMTTEEFESVLENRNNEEV